MASITAALNAFQPGPTPVEQGYLGEVVDITGVASVGGETVAYTCQFMSNPLYMRGSGLSATFAGGVATIKAEHALGNDTETVMIVGIP